LKLGGWKALKLLSIFGFPASQLSGFPAFQLPSFPASQLSGFPASQLSGFSASQLFMAEMQTAKRVSPDLSMIRTIVKLWGRERKRSRTLILVFRIIIHIFSE
jgi:hypothetical protein